MQTGTSQPKSSISRTEVQIINQFEPNLTDSSQNIEAYLATQAKFKYKTPNNSVEDARPALVKALVLLAVEQLVVFVFQLISYLSLSSFWNNSRWITGTILFICYVPLVAANVFVSTFPQTLNRCVVKLLEGILFFFLMGWAVAFFDFAVMSGSYLVVADIIIILIFMLIFKVYNNWANLVIAVFIIVDLVAKTVTISKWYYSAPVAVIVTVRLISLNFTCKQIEELSNMNNPRTYLGVTIEFTVKLWIDLVLTKKTDAKEAENNVETAPVGL